MEISTVIITKNEEKNIKRCIKSVDWCDEVLIVDDFSTDATCDIARKEGAKIIQRFLDGDWAAQRNYGLKKTRYEWVLFIDADEVVSEDLKKEMLEKINNNLHYDGFLVRRSDFIWGRKLRFGEAGRSKLLRLAKKSSGQWKRKVHEYWDVKGKVGLLRSHLNHYPHPTLESFLDRVNRYSTLHARENFREGKRSNLFKIVFFPFFKFIDNLFFKLGLMDGIRGIVIALMMSFHSFLSWSKLWLMQKK